MFLWRLEVGAWSFTTVSAIRHSSWGIKYSEAAVWCSMTTQLLPSPSLVPEVNPARAYRLAHAGRLMIIQRKEGRELAVTDFFRFDAVGTHPTGLIVTGVFQDMHRAHMMATGVREANAAEAAWLTAATEKLSPQENTVRS